jgi:hypothetical protein
MDYHANLPKARKPSEDIYSRMPFEDVKSLTRTLIDAIVTASKRKTAAERQDRTGQTSLF